MRLFILFSDDELDTYGYTQGDMVPVNADLAAHVLEETTIPVYILTIDNDHTGIKEVDELRDHPGFFGLKRSKETLAYLLNLVKEDILAIQSSNMEFERKQGFLANTMNNADLVLHYLKSLE